MNKRIIKILSKMLAFAILSTNTAHFAALNTETGSAVIEKHRHPAEASPDTEENKRVSIIKDVKNTAVDFKDLVKKHPSIQLALLLTLGKCATKKLTSAVTKQAQMDTISQLTRTAADSLTADQVKDLLSTQIDKYTSRDPDVFEIEASLIEQSNPKLLLLTLTKLNRLFDKYSAFTAALIQYKHRQGEKFTLLPLSIRYYPLPYLRAEELSEYDLGGMAFGLSGDYEGTLYKYFDYHRTNWFAACDNDQLVEFMVAHEFGHVMEFLHITLEQKITWTSCTKPRGRYTLGIILGQASEDNTFKTNSLVKDSATSIGSSILTRARAAAKFHYSMLSRYADSDASLMEFFAETFAHSECSTYVNPLGQVLQEYIKDWFPLDPNNATISADN